MNNNIEIFCVTDKHFNFFNDIKYKLVAMERWPSGLRRTLGKCVYPHRYRGFESHSLRQLRGL